MIDAFDALDAMDANDTNDAMRDASPDVVDGGSVPLDAPVGAPIPLALGSSTFWLYGFTSDGFFIYTDRNAVYAVPVAGGLPELIYANTAAPSALPSAWIEGRVVVASTGDAKGLPAVVWSHAMGPRAVPAGVYEVQPSRDGTRLGYRIVTFAADGGLADIQFAESDIDFSNPIVFPTVPARLFPQSIEVMDTRFLVPRVNYDPDADAAANGIDSYSNAGAPMRLLDGWTFWRRRDEVVVFGGPRTFLARDASGGPTTTIDVPGDGGALDPINMTPDGRRIVFGDGTAGFWSSSTSSASPVNLPGTNGLTGTAYLVMAPDSLHFAAWQKGGAAILATTAPGGAITVPSSGAIGSFVSTPDFSADSRYFLASHSALTALTAIAVDTGASTRIALDVDCTGNCWQRAHGATVLYVTKGSLFSVDIDHIASPTKLGDSVVRFMANAEGTVAVSLVKDPNSAAASGLYAVNIP